MIIGMSTKRTIVFMTRGVHSPVGFGIWRGLKEQVGRLGVRLITIDALGVLGTDGSILYELIDRKKVDGIITWANDVDKHTEFYKERLVDIPTVSLTQKVLDYPVVRVDMRDIMKKCLKHLIEVHGFKRILFMRGTESNDYFTIRYKAYKDTLQEYGIEFNPRFVSDPPKDIPNLVNVTESMDQFLDRNGLAPGKDFDAIMCVNELSSIYTIKYLQGRGYHIPDDVAVTSYDNSVVGRAISPKPTAQVMPFGKQSQAALDLLLSMLDGKSAPPESLIEAYLEINASCGCTSQSLKIGAAELDTGLEARKHLQRQARQETEKLPVESIEAIIAQELIDHVKSNYGDIHIKFTDLRSTITAIVDAYFRQLADDSQRFFLDTLGTSIKQFLHNNVNLKILIDLVSFIRRNTIRHIIHSPLLMISENMLFLAGILLTENMVQVEEHELADMESRYGMQRSFLMEITSKFDFKVLFERMTFWLPKLGVYECYVVLYENPRSYVLGNPIPAYASLRFGLKDGKSLALPEAGERFVTADVLPQTYCKLDLIDDLYLVPLFIMKNQIGYLVVVNAPQDTTLFVSIAGQISNTINGVNLIRERQRAEENVQSAFALLQSKATSVQTESEAISSLVSDISSAMDEVTGNIRAISTRIAEVMHITLSAVNMAVDSNAKMTDLNAESQKIGSIALLIEDITQRTKVLSINAKIEAAHAGQAGKGFSIVAQEIEKLAEETNRSTGTIGEMISNIQGRSTQTQQIMGQIVEINRTINDLSAGIQSAIAENVHKTGSISEKLQQASEGSRQIFNEIAELTAGREQDPA